MSVYVSKKLQQQVRNQFASCCAYCRTAELLTATTFEIEHIIPLSTGGKTQYDNLCLACPTCNRYKAARRTGLDPQTDQIVPLFHPQQQSWNKHFSWSADSTQISSLTPTSRATCTALKMNRDPLLRVRKMWVKLGEHPPNI
ncbi:MAG: HNH endonuclease signature motif containing protein [Cyanobacteria bacterium J06648_10]